MPHPKKYTDEQLISHLVSGGTCTEFAKLHNINSRGVRKRRQRLADKGRMDELGITLNIPEGRHLGKVTAQYKADGTLIQHWSRITKNAHKR